MSRAINLLFLLLFFSCSSKVEFSIEDLQKHDELRCFVQSEFNYEGNRYIDQSTIEIIFNTNLSKESYFDIVDSLSLQIGWVKCFESSNYRIFIFDKFEPDSDSIPQIVKLKYYDQNSIVAIDVQ